MYGVGFDARKEAVAKGRGYQTEHIHPNGWVSGVIYLQIPDFDDSAQGNIEFGLWGSGYKVKNSDYPKRQHRPKAGQIILFPSSLYHRTLPFDSEQERVCIAFDLFPEKSASVR